MSDNRRIALKYRVTQEYEVVVYYENGLSAGSLEEAEEHVIDDVLNFAFNADGLVLQTDDENENSNAVVALVTTFDPEVEEVYNIREVPNCIKIALMERKLL